MPAEPIARLFARLRRCTPAGGASDADLLGRFIETRDDAAFALLVHRHAPMVMGVCRRVLGNEADAEDACQATFLVLVRRAGAVRPREGVGAWLHGVARNVARRAGLMAARRRRREADAGIAPRPAGPDAELRELLDHELDRLPARFKSAVVLCDLEGLTRPDAARQLGLPEGTVASRLARGRQLLARRLSRAGLAGSTLVIGTALAPEGAGAVPAPLFEQLTRFGAGHPPGASPAAVALTHGVLRAMSVKRLTTLAAGLFVTAGLVLAARSVTPAATAQAPPAAPPKAAAPAANGGDESLTVHKVPPVVVKTVPTAGAEDVDPGLSEIKVTFSKDMADRSWSWSTVSEDLFPKTVGDKPFHYEKDKRTCVLKVKLEPGKTYGIWVNSQKFTNFKDADGRPAVPYLLVFKTKKAD